MLFRSHRKLSFTNRYGIALAADLYLPRERGAGPSAALAALAISGPFGAVKEQASGLYAQTLAELGFATLAFDPSYTGESGGTPRHLASPEINTEDFSAAVDALGLLPEVDRQRIGVIGICGFGGMALNAATVDPRIKAVATTVMYDMSRVMARGYFDSTTPAQRALALAQLSAQRWTDAQRGAPALAPRGLPETAQGIENPIVQQYFDYYRTPRGFHPRSINSNGGWTVTTPLSFMAMPLMAHIAEISPRPVLIVAGEQAHSRYFSEDAYQAAAEPKQLVIVPGAIHADLYDQVDQIPFDLLANFFQQHLG